MKKLFFLVLISFYIFGTEYVLEDYNYTPLRSIMGPPVSLQNITSINEDQKQMYTAFGRALFQRSDLAYDGYVFGGNEVRALRFRTYRPD